ncbi:DUF4097 family beta strand repeat-containing protein [Jiangella gansuensis]|uniref:DUF4097 family beta strand repeat-containing protein n=1 Tax=Jiangella gansuensis TaxID=281473 RepID=UPI00047B5C23|nr:DUF4097 family beta strand repeat-containing protein [Jiangella gansuensis]
MSDFISQTFPAEGPISLSVEQRSGDVEVTAADTTEVEVRLHPSGPGGDDLAQRTTVEYRPGALRIKVPRSTTSFVASAEVRASAASVDIVVTVPAGSDAEVETSSGDVQLTGRFGEVSGRAGSGDLSIESGGDVRVVAGSGDVRIGSCAGVSAKTGSGEIRIGRVTGGVELQSGSGGIEVDGPVTDARLSAASGDIGVGTVAGRLTVKTASGDITVRRAEEGDITVRAASGDVTVGLAAGTAAKLDVSSVTGSVRSDLDATDAPAASDRTLLLAVKTVSGSVRLHRAG